MELYIGGYKQGKLRYVLSKHPNSEQDIINDVHLWIKKLIRDGEDPMKTVLRHVEKNPNCILICDEIGDNAFSASPGEKQYITTVNNILVELADRADRVERVTCGLGMRLK